MSLARSLGSPEWRRAVALAILALLIAAAWLGPVNAYVDLVAAGADELADEAALLQRYRALADQAATETSQPMPPAPSSSPALMLDGASEAQAVALLQETVKNAAAASRVQIQSAQVLRSETLPGAVRIGVRIRAAGDVAGLARLLFAVEAERPVLYPDNLQIHVQPGAPGRAGEALDIQLDISGFVTRGAAS